jgi:curved DNA-binding protein CbpA
MFEEHYKTLELEPNASDDDVKKAYKKMAMKHHPDKNPDNKEEAEVMFKKIAEAYEILTNKDKYMNINQEHHFNGFDPHEIFKQMFKEMHIQREHNMNSNIRVNIGNPFSGFGNIHMMQSNGMMSQQIRIVNQTINGETMQQIFVTGNGGSIPPEMQHIIFGNF